MHFARFRSDLRLEGVPSKVILVRSDDGGKFSEGKFGRLCRDRNTKQEFTTADSPEFNGVAERGLAMIESASSLAARIKASVLFPGFRVSEGPSLCAEAMNWACDAYIRTATIANPGNRSPYEMFYGEPPQTSPIPFLKPGFCKHKRINKMDPKARACFYLGPARNNPTESKRVLVDSGKVVVTRNVTGANSPSSYPINTQSKPPEGEEGEEEEDETEDR